MHELSQKNVQFESTSINFKVQNRFIHYQNNNLPIVEKEAIMISTIGKSILCALCHAPATRRRPQALWDDHFHTVQILDFCSKTYRFLCRLFFNKIRIKRF